MNDLAISDDWELSYLFASFVTKELQKQLGFSEHHAQEMASHAPLSIHLIEKLGDHGPDIFLFECVTASGARYIHATLKNFAAHPDRGTAIMVGVNLTFALAEVKRQRAAPKEMAA